MTRRYKPDHRNVDKTKRFKTGKTKRYLLSLFNVILIKFLRFRHKNNNNNKSSEEF